MFPELPFMPDVVDVVEVHRHGLAGHAWDMRSAQGLGLRTAYVLSDALDEVVEGPWGHSR
ncbi:hypothetical protein ABN028_24350 [Actinopolymorpha sp. B17G11]|uniref:hypothetical protein n=1 Tax=Actinopolymorpha sp. B17G11 TaxID=3160861 RepID=UPI0032E4F849